MAEPLPLNTADFAWPDQARNPLWMKKRRQRHHSVFTPDLIDAAGEPTRQAVDQVTAFLRECLIEERAIA